MGKHAELVQRLNSALRTKREPLIYGDKARCFYAFFEKDQTTDIYQDPHIAIYWNGSEAKEVMTKTLGWAAPIFGKENCLLFPKSDSLYYLYLINISPDLKLEDHQLQQLHDSVVTVLPLERLREDQLPEETRCLNAIKMLIPAELRRHASGGRDEIQLYSIAQQDDVIRLTVHQMASNPWVNKCEQLLREVGGTDCCTLTGASVSAEDLEDVATLNITVTSTLRQQLLSDEWPKRVVQLHAEMRQMQRLIDKARTAILESPQKINPDVNLLLHQGPQ